MFFQFIGQPGIINFIQIKKMMVGVYDFKFKIKLEKSGRLIGVLKSGLSGGFMFSVSFPR